jgi:hypothetical protein
VRGCIIQTWERSTIEHAAVCLLFAVSLKRGVVLQKIRAGSTALHLAAKDTAVVEALYARGVNVSGQDVPSGLRQVPPLSAAVHRHAIVARAIHHLRARGQPFGNAASSLRAR